MLNKPMYCAGALTWYEKEYDELERMQREMGRWIWGCKLYVKNELVQGETGWSSFREREVKAKIKWLVRLAFSGVWSRKLVGHKRVSERQK